MTDPEPVSPSASVATNRRSAERTRCVLEVAIADDQQTFLAATVLDVSRGGVKLQVDPPPAPGEKLRLTFLAIDGQLFQIAATVVHYLDHEGAFAVGCRFARELSEQEVQALL